LCGYLGAIKPHFCLNSGKNKGKSMYSLAFLAITALFLIAAYFAGVLPGGIQ